MSIRTLTTPPLTLLLAIAMLASAGCGGAQARKAKHLEKGHAFLAAGNLDKARVEFQNALQIAPTDAEARLEMGVVDEKLGRPREAAQFYQGVIDVSPDHAEARARLARLYLFSGAPDRALELIKPGLERHPDDAGLLIVRAAVRAQQKDPGGALADAERAVQLAPASEDAVAVLAGVYKAAGDVAKAQTLLERSVQTIPDTIDLRLALAQIYAQESRPADAEIQLLKIISLRPREAAARLRLARFYLQSGQVDAAEHTLREAVDALPADLDAKLSLVDFLAAHRNREAAEKELKAMIDASAADAELKFALAKFYQEGGEPARAEAVYRAVIDREKLNAAGLSARDRLAALRVQDDDMTGALALVNEVLAKSPRDDEALMVRGSIALARKDPRSAIADLRSVLRDQPNAVGVLRSLARAHLANGEPAIAEETMRRAVGDNPTNPALELDFAQLLMQLGKPEQARTIIAELVKQKPDSVEALDAQFRIAMASNDLATAKSSADAVAALRPKLAIGYMYQGIIAETEKRNDDALRLYTTAADLQPGAAEPLEAVVRLLANTKRLPQALARLDEAAAKFPDQSLALDIKGEVLLQTGRTEEASEAFRQAIARTPKWWRPYRGLANAQTAAKNPAAAAATLRAAMQVVEQGEVLGELLASLLESQGKPEEAIREYEDILRRYPQSEVAANNLAMLLATYKTDAASLDRARDLASRFANSPNPSFLDTYGWVLFKRGDAAGSVPVLARVVAKTPNVAVARYHLGMAQSLAGDDSGARENLMRAVNSGSQFYGLDEAKATLDKLAKSPATTAVNPKG